MADIHDLADLIAAHRAELERAYNSEILRLKATYGGAAVEQALEIARKREAAAAGKALAEWSSVSLPQDWR